MIAENFDARTLANMEVALEEACKSLPAGAEQHEYRRFIASRIIECAEAGDMTLRALAEAARRAANELRARDIRARNSTRAGARTPMRQFAPAMNRVTKKAATATPAVTAQENPTRTAT